MNIDITRSTNNYEKIVIEYEKDGETTRVSNKEIGECTSDEYSLSLSNVTKVIIQVEINNDDTDYNILIEQEGLDFSYPSAFTNNKKLVEYFTIVLGILAVIIFISLVFFWVWRLRNPCVKSRKQLNKNKQSKIKNSNTDQIDSVMDKMVNRFRNILKIIKSIFLLVFWKVFRFLTLMSIGIWIIWVSSTQNYG